MRPWKLAPKGGERCGLCGSRVAEGGPVQLIVCASVKLSRCAKCADAPLPADLPDVPVKPEKVRPLVSTHGMTRVGRLATDHAFDWKQKASGA